MSLWYIIYMNTHDLPMFPFEVYAIEKKVMVLSPCLDRSVIGLVFDEWEVDSRLIGQRADDPVFYYQGYRPALSGGEDNCVLNGWTSLSLFLIQSEFIQCIYSGRSFSSKGSTVTVSTISLGSRFSFHSKI